MTDAAKVGAYCGTHSLHLIGRLRPDTAAPQLRGDLLRVAGMLRTENPLWTPDSAAYITGAGAVPLREQLDGSVRHSFLLLLGAVALLLIIACVNVTNLLLARDLARAQELTVRAALGAGRGRLVRQLLTESLVLALLCGAAGTLVAAGGLQPLVPILPSDTPRLAEVALDGRVLAFAVAAAIATSLLVGLVPALRASRHGDSVPHGGHGAASGRTRRLSGVLVMVEIALAVVLVTGAAFLAQGFSRLQLVDVGFQASGITSARLSPAQVSYATADVQRAFHARVLARAATLPGVTAAALVSQLPFDQQNASWATAIRDVTSDPNSLPMFDRRSITPDYFRVLEIPLRAGRLLT